MLESYVRTLEPKTSAPDTPWLRKSRTQQPPLCSRCFRDRVAGVGLERRTPHLAALVHAHGDLNLVLVQGLVPSPFSIEGGKIEAKGVLHTVLGGS